MNYKDFRQLAKEDLKTDKDVQLYLDIAIEDYLNTQDKGQFLSALRLVSEIKGGLTKLSKETKLQREHLYTMLSKRGNPSFENIIKIIKAFGYKIVIRPQARMVKR